MFYIYIIYSETADKYYTGYSEDPWSRIIQHNENDADKYTGKYDNWQLAAVFEVSEDRGEAMKLEKFIKKQKTKKLIDKLIDPDFVLTGALAQLVRVPVEPLLK
jgi:putative endonuclease